MFSFTDTNRDRVTGRPGWDTLETNTKLDRMWGDGGAAGGMWANQGIQSLYSKKEENEAQRQRGNGIPGYELGSAAPTSRSSSLVLEQWLQGRTPHSRIMYVSLVLSLFCRAEIFPSLTEYITGRVWGATKTSLMVYGVSTVYRGRPHPGPSGPSAGPPGCPTEKSIWILDLS